MQTMHTQPAPAAAARPSSADPRNPGEFLAFALGDEDYAIPIQSVQELRGYDAVTRIANAPEFIKGVVNLRGIIVPIVDMRIKFNLGTPSYDQFTVVIVLNVAGRIIGMVVDSVSDVIALDAGQIKPAPAMGSALDTGHVTGIGTLDGRLLILLDVERLILLEEIALGEPLSA